MLEFRYNFICKAHCFRAAFNHDVDIYIIFMPYSCILADYAIIQAIEIYYIVHCHKYTACMRIKLTILKKEEDDDDILICP